MMSDADRRQDARRNEDRVVSLRLDRVEKDVEHLTTTVESLGSAVGHLALVDSRVDENRRRIETLEKSLDRIEITVAAVQVALEAVRVRVMVGAGIGSLVGAGLVALLVRFAGG